MWTQIPSYRFEIDNFSEKKSVILSKTFVSGGCEWSLDVYPKGDSLADNKLSLYLRVANTKSLRTGWKISANYYIVLLNQSGKELYRSSTGQASNFFCAETSSWGWRNTLPLSKFQEKDFLEKDRLIIEVYIKVIVAVDGEGYVSEKKKNVNINGFQVFASQVTSARKLFAEHPDIAEDFKPMNEAVKTAYMKVLLNLIEKLEKPSKTLSEIDLRNACSELSELMDVGFKLDWLKLKIEELSLEKKKADADESRVQQLEERVKNLELMELGFKLDSLNTKLDKVSLERKKSDDESRTQQQKDRVHDLELMALVPKLDSLNAKIDEVSLERKKSEHADAARAQELDKRIKNFELMGLGFQLDFLNTKLDEVSLERKKSEKADEARAQELDEVGIQLKFLNEKLEEVSLERKKSDEADESRVQQLDDDVKDLGFKLDCLNTKLEEVSLERKKSNDAEGSRVQQLEGNVKLLKYLEFRLDRLNAKLEEASLDRKKSDDAEGSRVKQLEEHVNQMGFKQDCLNAKLLEVLLERKKFDDANGSRVQQLEESVKNFELMVSYLKVELAKKKDDKSSDDGFLLVD